MFLWSIDPQGENIEAGSDGPQLAKYIPNADLHRRVATRHRAATTNLYRCADGKWFQLHGSLNPDPVLDAIDLPREYEAQDTVQAKEFFQDKIRNLTSSELLGRIVEARQAGDICCSFNEFLTSEQAKENAHVGLFETEHRPSASQKPCWWPCASPATSERPLAGLKVVDLTRIIAAPTVTRGLAELGASVMRVTSPNLPDFHMLHPDLNWGKWNTYLDFTSTNDRETLKEIVLEADVVVSGYRPFVLDKHGFGKEDILKLVSDRERGIIFVQVNSYGWYGPSKDRPGYQPISDACVGISHGYGQALGLKDNEPVTALCPNADYSTGLAGVGAVLGALIQRAERGGSYTVELALNYYNRWLAQFCGEYPEEVWNGLWESYGRFQFRSHQSMEQTSPVIVKMMAQKGFLKEDYFHVIRSGILGVDLRCISPVIKFPHKYVKLGYNVGARGNGTDVARWPADLTTEVVV